MRAWIDFPPVRRLPQAAMAILALALAWPAHADQYHYVNLLIGDRASGMGGAYTAISDDPAGLYYNPAGIVYSPSANLSASMNAFNFTRTTYKAALGGRDWERTSSSLLPNFFGVIQPLGPGVLGFSYAVPDSIIEDQDQQYPGVPTSLSATEDAEFTINFNNQDSTYNAGPSYAVALTPDLSVGATLYAFQRTKELISNQVFQLSTGYHWENTYVHVEEYGVKPILGIMWSPLEKFAMGISGTWPQIIHGANFTQQSCATEFSVSSSLCQQNTLVINQQDVNFKRDLPWSLDMGIALFPSSALLVSAKGSLYEDIYRGGLPLWNAALGMEYYLSSRLAMRAGAYTDNANTPDVRQGATGQAEHVDLYGGSLSLTRFTRSSAITVGANGSLGLGKAQVVAGNPNRQDVTLWSLTVFMSASYSY